MLTARPIATVEVAHLPRDPARWQGQALLSLPTAAINITQKLNEALRFNATRRVKPLAFCTLEFSKI
ncbi:hypothetical protein NXC24_CH00403 [Rhizobium sp. NXC24]|nr:hypothetical protein NXC24_CH00403 [Rhizobium sp. NXC24]